ILPDFGYLADDNCDDNLFITQDPLPGEITSNTPVTLTAKDDFGNVSATCEFSIELETDPEPPFQLQCIGNYTVELEDNSIRIPTSQFVTGDLTGIEFKIEEQYFDCADIGTKTITIEATKISTGETANCTVEVEVIDIGKPFMVCFAEDQLRYLVEG